MTARTESKALPVFEAEALPVLYDRWMRELLPAQIPRERLATCDACPMCAADRAVGPSRSADRYSPETKCCTFLPSLPNFLAGAILADRGEASAAGRESLLARIQAGVEVTPMAVRMTPGYQLAYQAVKANHFGTVTALRCPHYVDEGGGKCGIWAYRNGVCATYFCRHARGRVGRAFWADLRILLQLVEDELSLWCVAELGLAPSALRCLMADHDTSPQERLTRELSAQVAGAIHRDIWGEWKGREVEFYRASYELVAPLRWSEVLRVGGARPRAQASVVLDSFARLTSRAVPARLVRAKVVVLDMSEEGVHVCGAGASEPIRLTATAFHALARFDGRPTSQVLEEIRASGSTGLDEPAVSDLVDHGILIAT